MTQAACGAATEKRADESVHMAEDAERLLERGAGPKLVCARVH